MKVKKTTHYELSCIIDKRTPIGLFYAKVDNVFIAVDNHNGEAWTEDFNTEDEAIAWLDQREMVIKETEKESVLVKSSHMLLNSYQELANETAIYPQTMAIIYPTLGLTGEAGEVSDKVKKVLRDQDGEFQDEKKLEIAKELGDVLWYVSTLARDLGYTLEEVARMNIDKLKSRQQRGMLGGSGDNR